MANTCNQNLCNRGDSSATRHAAFTVLGVLLCLLIVGCSAPAPPTPSVVILGLDGLDPTTIDLMVGEGRLPNLALLRDHGASGTLLAEPPLLSPILWTTMATGKPALEHGIGHFVAVDPATGAQMPATSTLRKVEALWNIASAAGLEVATVGWWATWPPEPIRGTVVSDHIGYHFLFSQGSTSAAREDAIAPPDEAERLLRFVRRPDAIEASELQEFAEIPADEWDRPFDFDDEVSHLRWAYATTDSYRRIALDLLERRQPDLTMIYIEATDSVSHLFGHLFRQENLAGDLLEQQRRFGGTVEAMYDFADRIVGEILAALPENATLIVLSDHGFQLGELPDDPTQVSGERRRVNDDYHLREGVVIAWGRAVRAGAQILGATQLDVAPTVLALLGLDVPLDMPGRVLDEALELTIPERVRNTYETGRRDGLAVASSPEVNENARLRLEALGYLDPQPSSSSGAKVVSVQGEINLAGLAYKEGRYEDAIEIYQGLLQKMPDEVRLYISLAAAYGGAGNYPLAEQTLHEALKRNPSDSRAHYNLGMIAELQKDLESAVGHYQDSLRFNPDFEASRQALNRLGEAGPGDSTLSAQQMQALEICDEARDASRRGDYDRAAELIERAFELDPRSAIVLQYRSNIAFLREDYGTAIDSLEAALEIEPDNVLFQRNLTRLRDGG